MGPENIRTDDRDRENETKGLVRQLHHEILDGSIHCLRRLVMGAMTGIDAHALTGWLDGLDFVGCLRFDPWILLTPRQQQTKLHQVQQRYQ